jgi:NADPH-dependent curcumin reductase
MTEATARHIVLAARPHGKPQLTDFRLEETAIPTPSAGQMLLRVQYLALDPYRRGRMDTGSPTRRRSRSVVSWMAHPLRR